MTRFNRSLARTGTAALALGIASVVAVGTALPAGASTPPAAQSDQPPPGGNTPMCLVGAALFYPVFLGGVLFQNPASLPSAAPGYWAGGTPGDHGPGNDKDSKGWISGCGVTPSK